MRTVENMEGVICGHCYCSITILIAIILILILLTTTTSFARVLSMMFSTPFLNLFVPDYKSLKPEFSRSFALIPSHLVKIIELRDNNNTDFPGEVSHFYISKLPTNQTTKTTSQYTLFQLTLSISS